MLPECQPGPPFLPFPQSHCRILKRTRLHSIFPVQSCQRLANLGLPPLTSAVGAVARLQKCATGVCARRTCTYEETIKTAPRPVELSHQGGAIKQARYINRHRDGCWRGVALHCGLNEASV